MKQLHKRFTNEQMKELLGRYERGEVTREILEKLLEIGKTRFFELIGQYRKEEEFSISYKRSKSNNKIETKIEKEIRKELEIDKKLIEDKRTPLKVYNYSQIQREIEARGKKVSVSTIRNRAKEWGYRKERRQEAKKHDRIVISSYTGEIVQHDASPHVYAIYNGEEWQLISSIDDHSRFILYAKLYKRESSVAHIKALEEVFIRYGLPMKYYTDNHSIFRYIAGRDEMVGVHKEAYIKTDGVDTQWGQVLRECGVGKMAAMSPQAKGKIERSYRWIQDHLVRKCARRKIKRIEEAQEILDAEIEQYNYKRMHSTIEEIPGKRFERARRNNSMWRDFEIPYPYETTRDIFALRKTRRADGYRRISIDNVELRLNGINPYDDIEIRIYVIDENLSEFRFWKGKKLVDVKTVKNIDFKSIHY